MKLKLFIAFCAVTLGVTSAAAAPPPGKGKPETRGNHATAGKPATTGPLCRPKVTVVLKGTVTSAGAGVLGIKVTQSNRWGRAYATLGTATVAVDGETKVRRNGDKLLVDLTAGDRVLVQARACKTDLSAHTSPPTLTAVRVVAHPAKA